jgi:hypothetical protein
VIRQGTYLCAGEGAGGSRQSFLRRRRHHACRERSWVAGLVYITAFAPDIGESVGSLIANPPPGAPVPPILPPRDGLLFLDKNKFAASFAADVDAPRANFMAKYQVPLGPNALNGAVSEAAWKKRPSWYLVATEDRMIPPPAQRPTATRAGATIEEVRAATPSTFRSPGGGSALQIASPNCRAV